MVSICFLGFFFLVLVFVSCTWIGGFPYLDVVPVQVDTGEAVRFVTAGHIVLRLFLLVIFLGSGLAIQLCGSFLVNLGLVVRVRATDHTAATHRVVCALNLIAF